MVDILINHADIADPDIHESKGVGAASVGELPFATGAGTTVHRKPLLADASDGVVTATAGDIAFADGAGSATHRKLIVSDINAEASTDGQALFSDGAGNASWQTRTPIPNTVTSGTYFYEDVTTQTTPIPLTTPGTPYVLTNDAAGSDTMLFPIPSLPTMWDATLNQFVWSTGDILTVGDVIDFRLDVTATTSVPNTAISVYIVGDVGGAGEITIQLIPFQNFKTSGTYSLVRWMGLFMRNTDILEGISKVYAVSDAVGSTIKVNGWLLRASHLNT